MTIKDPVCLRLRGGEVKFWNVRDLDFGIFWILDIMVFGTWGHPQKKSPRHVGVILKKNPTSNNSKREFLDVGFLSGV